MYRRFWPEDLTVFLEKKATLALTSYLAVRTQSSDTHVFLNYQGSMLSVRGCNGYLGHPFKKYALRDGERSTFPACKQRWVGVHSDVVTSILMLERHYAHVMEKLLVWVEFSPLSSG
jgi:hypothetical protein